MPEATQQNSQANEADQSASTQEASDASQQTTTQTADGSQAAYARPDWMPETAWDAATNAPKIDELGKSFKELSDFKAATEAQKAALPDAAEKYEVKLPDEFQMPDGWTVNADDPAWKAGREFAHKNGLSQEQFSSMAALYIEQQIAAKTANDALVTQAVAARDKALGSNGAQRVDALNTWFKAEFGEQVGTQLGHALFTPEIVGAFEQIQKTLVTQGISGFAGGSGRQQEGRADGKPENWDSMSAVDRRTWNLQQAAEQKRA